MLPLSPAPKRDSTLSRSLFLAACLAFTPLALADVALPPIFTDHMVLQRDQPIRIWGTADPYESVSISLGERALQIRATANGSWSVELPPLPASTFPRQLVVAASNTLTFDDVLIGEVWLLSGQSNMDKPLGEKKGQVPTIGYPEVLEQTNLPNLRLFRVPNNVKIKHASLESHWIPCSSEVIDPMQFSAVGFHFGQKLLQELEVPIGLIHAAFGGTMIEAWMPESAFRAAPELEPLLAKPYFSWVEGVQATELYQSMIAPLAPYGLKGFLWYQGEANVMHGDGPIYAVKQRALVDSWRAAWRSPDAPFYFAQLAPFIYSEFAGQKMNTPDALPQFWTVQAELARDRHSGIIPTSDLVSNVKDIHPPNKRDVGLRFARLALHQTYGYTDIAAHAPSFESAEFATDGSVHLRLAHAATGLSTSDNLPPRHFELAGDNARFHPAKAKIANSTLLLASPQVPSPKFVRHAWHEKAEPNTVNAAGLPLLPFTTIPQTYPTLQPNTQRPLRFPLDRFQPTSPNTKSLTQDKLILSLSPSSNQQTTLSLAGLSEGPHSLCLAFDTDPSNPILALGSSLLRPTSIDPARHLAHFEFDLAQTQNVTARWPDAQTLLAIELDVPNPVEQAIASPEASSIELKPDGTLHLNLSWLPGPHSLSYRIYLTSDLSEEKARAAALKAGPSSSSLVSETSDTHLSVVRPHSPERTAIAWRIDSIDPTGKTTRGTPQTFLLTTNPPITTNHQ